MMTCRSLVLCPRRRTNGAITSVVVLLALVELASATIDFIDAQSVD